jgi:hypothetical protein
MGEAGRLSKTEGSGEEMRVGRPLPEVKAVASSPPSLRPEMSRRARGRRDTAWGSLALIARVEGGHKTYGRE